MIDLCSACASWTAASSLWNYSVQPRIVSYESLLNVDVEKAIHEHEIQQSVLEYRCEDLSNAGGQSNRPEITRIFRVSFSRCLMD